MKKLYYFSKTKLQFVEITNFKVKFLTSFVLAVFIASSLAVGGYYLIYSASTSEKGYSELRNENQILRDKISDIVTEYKGLDKQLNNLRKVNDDLRIAANLPPISNEERMVGVGGGYIDNNIDFLADPENLQLKKALSYIDEVSRKIQFEKTLYKEITTQIKENKKLYSAMPAIKPCTGYVNHDFGMRMHPILHIRRMHAGIDISTDIGTPVYSTGAGRVQFVGYKGGYGLTVVIDHGFGYRTLYGHLSSAKVKRGAKVSRGDLIAKSGNSGLSSGPHVHYEVEHDGVKENPIEFFFDDFSFFEITNKKKTKNL
jgi:murein DD-endopeptidase MepM/ murein hydrolase activator NlpD